VKRDVIYREPFDRKKLLRSNRLAVLNVMHRKQVVEEIGTFNEFFTRSMDWEMWIRMSGRYHFYRIDKVTGEYRIRGGKHQLSSSTSLHRYFDNIAIFIHKLSMIVSFRPENPDYEKAMAAMGKVSSNFPETLDAVDLRYLTDRPQKMYPLFYTLGKVLEKEGKNAAARAAYRAAAQISLWEPKLYFAWARTLAEGMLR